MRLLYAFIILVASPAVAQDLRGQATVIDGDTIEIHGQRIRLNGIDAPESGQICQNRRGMSYRCGQKAALALADWIDRSVVSCLQTDTDRYGRIVAVCSVRGRNMNQWIVRQGWAIAYRKYSKDYIPDEEAARAARLGIWEGEFVPPDEWRKGRR